MPKEDFRQREILRQIEFKSSFLGIQDDGLWKGKPYPHILPWKQRFHNLWEPKRDYAIREFTKQRIAWHEGISDLLSSQALCVNLFYPFKNKNYRHIEPFFATLFPELSKIDFIGFEIGAGDARRYFGERGMRGKYASSPDVGVIWKDKGGSKNLLFLEFKYTESTFGHCSRGRNPNPERCLSSSRIVSNHSRECYRSQLGRRYWDIILSDDSPFVREALTTERYCPFLYDFYQLMRYQLLAHCDQKRRDYHFGRVDFGVVYHAGNDSLTRMKKPFDGESNPLTAWPRLLKNPDNFHHFTIQDFLGSLSFGGDAFFGQWRDYVRQRYGL